jgi:hypothetical protein
MINSKINHPTLQVLNKGADYQHSDGSRGCEVRSEDNSLGCVHPVTLRVIPRDAPYPNFFTLIVLFFCHTLSY